MLKDMTLTVSPGSSIAIVGESGTGKSTLLKIIVTHRQMRLFDPDEGKILIDDQDIRSVSLQSLRRSMSIVPQSTNLFNDTVLYNLSYGNADATRAQIEEVCRLVNLHDRILSMPKGYDTQVGELGSKLSGGERQRIAIARALLKDAQIFMFDEFSSALDSFNEKLIIDLIQAQFRNKTKIFIAHRLSSITHVDQIYVLGAEGLLESGTHEALLSRPGSYYSSLWEKFLHKETPISA